MATGRETTVFLQDGGSYEVDQSDVLMTAFGVTVTTDKGGDAGRNWKEKVTLPWHRIDRVEERIESGRNW